MKKKIINYLILFAGILIWASCEYKHPYDGGTVSPFISNFDIRKLYRGTEVTLNTTNMRNCTSIKGVVISDHSGKNLPSGLLIIQNVRRVGAVDSLRGIAIPIGQEAENYVHGDSVHVNIEGGVLKRLDGILQITGIPASAVTKIATGKDVPLRRVLSTQLYARPDDYESTFVSIVEGGFDPQPIAGDKYQGNKILTDGYGTVILHTEPTATFANSSDFHFNANYHGIIFNTVGEDGKLQPHHRMRKLSDAQYVEAPEVLPCVITGFMADCLGGDGDYEYMQFRATQDINFSQTPFSVFVCNNAGASTPGGPPPNGWVTGGGTAAGPGGVPAATNPRTFKFNLTSGTVAKGQFFYVGGSKRMINGSSSTSMTSSKWIRAFNYTTTDGDNGVGRRNGGLFANSGNASGFAIFRGTNITKDSRPIDCVFIGGNGTLFDETTGYRVGNTDVYRAVDPLTSKPQPFYRQGTNTFNLAYNSVQGIFYKLGGVYSPRLRRWMEIRSQNNLELTKTSPLSDIEDTTIRDVYDPTGEVIRTDTVHVTTFLE